jgi:hypothetical protein
MYVGFSVLEPPKLFMHAFHYDWVLKQYPREMVHPLLTDTDSVVNEIETEDVYKDLMLPENSDRFDFCNYMVVGKLKDQAKAHVVAEVVALRPKCMHTGS